MPQLQLISTAFSDNERIPDEYTAYFDNISPPLQIKNIPQGTKSFVLIMDDPDAQRVVGHTWDHWVMWDIPVTYLIKENHSPGIQGKGSNGKNAYHGPRPPQGSGVHHYFFKIYALDITLNIPTSSIKKDVEKAMHGHILENATLVGLYSK